MTTQIAALLAPKPFKRRVISEKPQFSVKKEQYKKLCRLVLPKREMYDKV